MKATEYYRALQDTIISQHEIIDELNAAIIYMSRSSESSTLNRKMISEYEQERNMEIANLMSLEQLMQAYEQQVESEYALFCRR